MGVVLTRRPVEDAGNGPAGKTRLGESAPARVRLVDRRFEFANAALQQDFGEIRNDLPGHVTHSLVADQFDHAAKVAAGDAPYARAGENAGSAARGATGLRVVCVGINRVDISAGS